jgi:hypothetical protein
MTTATAPVRTPRAATTDRSWGYGAVTLVVIGAAALFIFATATLFFAIGVIVPGGAGDAGTMWFLRACGAFIAGMGVFMCFGLVAMARTRIRLTGTLLDATVPDHHNVFLVPHFRTIRLDVRTLRSVERREEIVRWAGFPTMRGSLSVVTADGERIGLITAPYGTGATLPLDDIGAGIAAAAGTAVTDDGTVMSKAPGLYGAASSSWTETPLDPARAAKAKRGVVMTMQIVFMLFMLTTLLRTCG